MQGKTKSGFSYDIPENVFDNMELIDAIAESGENDLAVSRVVKLLLGGEGRKKLYDHLRGEDGRVPVKAVVDTVVEIFGALGQSGKNA